MREIPKYASNKPFFEMNTIEKLGLLGKLLIFISTMGFAYPRLIAYWGQGQPSKKVDMQKNTAALTH